MYWLNVLVIYTSHVLFVSTSCVNELYVLVVCSNCIYLSSVQDLCTSCVHCFYVPVLCVCFSYMCISW